MSKNNRPWRSVKAIGSAVGLALLLTACGGGGNDDPTVTSEPVAAANTATVEPPTPTVEPPSPTPTEKPVTPTPTPEPEPSATPTRSGPAPTVAAPIQRPPTAIPPAPTPEPEPTLDVPAGDTGEPTIGALLLESDLSDWEQVEFDFGSGFVAGDSYHINVTQPEGAYIILRSNQSDFGNVLVSLDVRMVTPSTESYGCITARADIDYQYDYAMCIGAQGQTRAIYEYFDADGNYFSETLFDFEEREGTNPATEWNNLAIIAFGEELGFFVNDTFLGLTTHSGPPAGSVGFYVENYDPNGVEFEFANLQVWAVE